MRINVTRSTIAPFEEYAQEIRELWDSRWLTNHGVKAAALEAALKEKLGVEQLELFTNGHLALEARLRAMGLEGEVITTPFTFASTTHALVRCGLTPVFADIRREDCTLDPDAVERLITERTCAILPVHVYGSLCDPRLEEIARKHGIPVIYDAAHAFGASRDGVSSAQMGYASMFSFHATKVFNTIEGGAIATGDAALAARLRLERNFGLESEDCIPVAGGNAKMNEFQAAMGLCNLRHLEDAIAQRKRVCESYRRQLEGVPGLRFLPPQPGVTSNYAYLPVFFKDQPTRDRVGEGLAKRDIFARKYFYPLTSAMDCYRGMPGFDPSLTPVAQEAAATVLTLPLYPELSDDQVAHICAALQDVMRHE